MSFLPIVIYRQLSRANQPRGRNWLTTILVHRGKASKEQLSSAIYRAARHLVPANARLELHYSGTEFKELPKGVSLHKPEWSGDGVRVWNCPMLGDLAPAVNNEAQTSLRDDAPRYGHRHEEGRHR